MPNTFHEQAARILSDRRDLFALSPPGAYDEAAYAEPVIERVVRDGPMFNPTALVLLPTREMAIQVHEAFFQLSGEESRARALGLFEGKPLTSQIGPLKNGVDVVIGTPGRVLEHIKRRTLRIEQSKILVLDRADEILDAGLGRDVEAIIGSTPKTRQTVILSATSPKGVLSMARDHLRDPELIGVDKGEFEDASSSPVADQVNVHFDAGKGSGVTPRDLLGAITNEGGLDRDRVGAITIKQNFSLVAVFAEDADDLVRKLRASRIKGRKVKVRPERFSHRPR
ncbi:MAG: DEAD/DEAH box helicase [Solirubrobacterales bacterium]